MLRHEYPSLRQGLVGAWCPSLGASGLSLIDRSGRNNHGTLTNMAGQDNWRASGSGISLQLDGVDDWVSTLGSPMPSGGSPRTVSAWVNKPDDSKYAVILECGPYTALNRYTLLVMGAGGYSGHTNRQVAVELYTSTTVSTQTIPINQWVHIAATSAATIGSIQIYINGVAATMTSFAPLTTAINTTPLPMGLLGRQFAGGNSYGHGSYDDLRIYNRVLTPAEIRLLASRRGIGLTPLPDRAAGLPRKLFVNDAGTWRNGDAYVNTGSGWRLGVPFVNVAGTWR